MIDVSRLGYNLEQRRDRGMNSLVGILTRVDNQQLEVKILLLDYSHNLSSGMKEGDFLLGEQVGGSSP